MPVTICFFLSGAAALILQVLWTRMLGHVFGATSLAVSTTLTAFMGGLALGSHLAGKRAAKMKHPVLMFAILESAVGLYGLIVPGLLSLMPAVQRAIGLDLHTGVLGYAILRFVVVSLILLLPTTAMGATLPILAEGIVKENHHMASRVGKLYAANTFGAVVGAFLAGFVLIPDLGIRVTVYIGASIDLFVAGTVYVLWRVGKGDSILTLGGKKGRDVFHAIVALLATGASAILIARNFGALPAGPFSFYAIGFTLALLTPVAMFLRPLARFSPVVPIAALAALFGAHAMHARFDGIAEEILPIAALFIAAWRRRDESIETADEILAEVEPIEIEGATPSAQRLALLVFAISGAAAMALEVLCTRTVGVVIGASTYSFTLILTTFLVGLAAGAAMMSRRIDLISDPVRVLAWVEVAVGGLAMAGAMVVDKLPHWVHATARAHDVTTESVYFTNFLIAAVVVFPSTLALGTVMPLVVRILAPKGEDHAGSIVGRAYTVNTIGAILGSFLGGFVVIPFIGVERGIQLASMISIGLGLLLAIARREGRGPIAAVAGAALLLIAFGPRWNVQAWTSGLFRMYLARNVYAEGWAPSGKLVYHKDGIATTVTVERENDGVGVSLKVNGKVDASDIGDMPTQVLSGLLPILVHEAPKNVLVIGYGSGVTSGAVLQSPIESLTLAEIEHAVYEASNQNFGHVNHEPWRDPRFHPVIDDGRNFLLTRDDKYDVIISEPSNPWMSGAASLFTRDFFQIAERRLADGGVFLQWLQLYELAPENIHALLRTFHAVFPNMIVFTPDPLSNDTLIIGTRTPVTIDKARIDRHLTDPRLAAELSRANVKSADDLFGLFLLGTNEIPKFVGDGPINTDDNALIEFGAPKDLIVYATKDARIPFLEGIEGKRLEVAPQYFSHFTLEANDLARIGYRLLGQGQLSDAEAFLKKAKAGGADTAHPDRILGLLQERDTQPVVIADERTKDDVRYARVVFEMTADRDKEALHLFEAEKDLDEVSSAHRFLYAYLCYRADRDLDAEYLMERVLKDEPFVKNNPPVLYYAAKIHASRGKYRDAVKYLELFAAADDAQIATRTSSATVAIPD
jgi:spermidine synthase